jgi:peptidoglycan/xylan/chitin deacetylase (PgdA/CDA1 family)
MENSAILLYHRVAPVGRDPFSLCVSPEHFGEQMNVARSIGTPVSIGNFTASHREGALQRNSIGVTFDDGYLDILENALPILERFEVPAVVYVVAGYLGRHPWWDCLIDTIYGPAKLPDRMELGPASRRLAVDTSRRTRREVFDRVYSYVLHSGAGERDGLVAAIGDLTGRPESGALPRLMSEGELRELSAHPLITIGAHTVTHSNLADLSPEAQGSEIEDSIERLSSTIGSPVTSFSYPFGMRSRDYTEASIAACKKAGLNHALAADPGVVNARSDPFSLPRLWVHDRGGKAFERTVRRWL